MIYFKENIKFCRQALGLTQEQIAQELQIHRGTYSTYECGSQAPYDILIKISRLFRFTAHELITENLQEY